MSSKHVDKVTLCIDPGVRNLSLCVMNSDHSILLWDVYNILDDDAHVCQSTLKNGNICNKKCTMKYNIDNHIHFSCKTHFPKGIVKTKSNDFKPKKIDSYLLQDIARICIERVQDVFDSNTEIFKRVDTVLIELQPKINQKIKFVSHILYGKLVELYKDYPNVTLRFVRASQKLRAYTGPPIQCNLKGAYAKRKWLSVQYTMWFLENKFSKEQREQWLPFFQSKTIKPDMSDTLLMAINSITGIPKKQLKHKNGNELK